MSHRTADSFARPFLRLSEAAIRRPRLALTSVLLVTLLALPGLWRLELRTDGHALVPSADPVVLFDRQVRQHFKLRDPLVVMLSTSHPDGIYNAATMRRVRNLSQALAALPEVGEGRVTSLATERRDRVYEGTLNFRPYLDPLPEDRRLLDQLRGDIAAVGLLEGTLVSTDQHATAILVGVPTTTSDNARRALDRVAIFRQVEHTAKAFASPLDRIEVVGAPAAEALLGLHLLQDLVLLVPLSMLLIATVMWLGCRRLWGVALGMMEIGACQLFTFGLLGWSGVPVYLTLAVLPVILTTIGLADEIHLLWHQQGELASEPAGVSRRQTVRATMTAMTRPIVLTTLTTSLGFASFLLSPIVPVRFFGLFAALGILFCMLWSLVAVPALMVLSPKRWLLRKRAPRQPSRHSLLTLGSRHPRWVLGLLALLSLGLGAGVFRLQVQDSWIDGFAPKSTFRQATDEVNERFFGTHLLLAHLTFNTPEEQIPAVLDHRGPLLDPELLNKIGGFETFARQRPEVGGVIGPHSRLAAANALLTGRKEENRRIPDTVYWVWKLLGHFKTAQGELRLRQMINAELDQAVVTIFLKDANYRQTETLMEALHSYAEEHLEAGLVQLRLAGDVAVSQAMIPAIVKTQVLSLLLALGGATLLLALIYRSLAAALAAVGPAMVAVLWTFGAMGWTGIPLGVATSMFCAITLGIGVDYGIHFFERYRLAASHGAEQPVAVALAEAGPAIITDSLAIAIGFGLLGFSQVPANARLGLLVALALGAACLLTLLGLAALLETRGEPAAKSLESI